MPSWMALAMPSVLDVKTVVSESPIPPYRDGAEFEETVFFDSAPQAFRSLLGRDRFRLNHILEGWIDDRDRQHPSPLNILTAAYTIHLDVNPKRGKTGYDANWGKLAELASDLETSPLYVFHYLAKFARGLDNDVPSAKRIQLYCYDLYPCFDTWVKGDQKAQSLKIMNQVSPLNHPKKLVELYRKFYRANTRYNPKANAVLKPIDVASDTLLKAESTVFQGEGLIETVAAEVFKLMDRVRSSTAEGRWQISNREEERQAILEFARYFVVDVFEKSFNSNRARMSGKQINLIRDTCEFLYRLEQDKENQENPPKSKTEEQEE
jgi:CRISPR-associated protein Csc3